MHREIVEERKLLAIINSLLIITIALYINSFMRISIVGNKIFQRIATIGIIFVVFLIVLQEIKRCRVCYKYSIISDKLIINAIDLRKKENLKTLSLNAKDILYIGTKKNLPKQYCKCKVHKYHTRDLENKGKLYCVYLKNGKVQSFVFKPSEKFIDKMNLKLK